MYNKSCKYPHLYSKDFFEVRQHVWKVWIQKDAGTVTLLLCWVYKSGIHNKDTKTHKVLSDKLDGVASFVPYPPRLTPPLCKIHHLANTQLYIAVTFEILCLFMMYYLGEKFSFQALTIYGLESFKDVGGRVTILIKDPIVCRAAAATAGSLNIVFFAACIVVLFIAKVF